MAFSESEIISRIVAYRLSRGITWREVIVGIEFTNIEGVDVCFVKMSNGNQYLVTENEIQRIGSTL